MSRTISPDVADDLETKIEKAQRVSLKYDEALSDRTSELIQQYSNAIGCPPEFILLPLQTVAAHFMGPDTTIQVHAGWAEPTIIWSVVLAYKGQKKSPALAFITKALASLEHCEISGDESDDSIEHHTKQIFVEHFSMEELHYTMKRNGGRVVGLYDEMSLLYEQLDRYKGGQADRKTLLSLINGGCWKRNFRSSTSTILTTHFNMTGFVQPLTVARLWEGGDEDGFLDRQQFACPKDKHFDYNEYVPLQPTTVKLTDLFKEIDTTNPPGSIYTLSDEARATFITEHDNLNDRIRSLHSRDHERRSILSKAHGQLLRLAAVHWALQQALQRLHCRQSAIPEPTWSYIVPVTVVKQAATLTNYFIAVKFCLCGGRPLPVEEQYDWHRLKRALELPREVLTPSLLTQNHVQRPRQGRYDRDNALVVLRNLADLGFGTIEPARSSNGSICLRKRKLSDLSEPALTTARKKIELDEDKYGRSFI